jgi:hypothetical protein
MGLTGSEVRPAQGIEVVIVAPLQVGMSERPGRPVRIA